MIYEYTFVTDNLGNKIIDNNNDFVITEIREVSEIPSGGHYREFITELFIPLESKIGFYETIKLNVIGIKVLDKKFYINIKSRLAIDKDKINLGLYARKAKYIDSIFIDLFAKIAKSRNYDYSCIAKKINDVITEILLQGCKGTDYAIGKNISAKKAISVYTYNLINGKKFHIVESEFGVKGKKDFREILKIILEDELK